MREEKLFKRNFPGKQRAAKFTARLLSVSTMERSHHTVTPGVHVCHESLSKVLLWLQNGENLEEKKTLRDIYRNECSSTFRSLPNITFFKLSVLLPHQLGLL